MRLAFKIGMSVLLLAGLAGSQEQTAPTAPTTPMNPPIRVNRHVPRQVGNPHVPDPWYPDPPPEGSTVNPTPQPVTAPTVTTAAPPGSGAIPGPRPAGAQPSPVQQTIDEQLPPATPPQVAYQNGLLTVRAFNSTLESVLTAIRNKAGIQFEGLEGGASERIVISMGPSPEGEVLATILGGSRFDYIVVDRIDSPGIVQRVLLTPRQGGAPTGPSGTRPPAPAMSTGDEEENADEGSAEPESPQDTPARAPVMQAQPQMQINPQPSQPQPNQQPTGPKTPEQLLEELKQMQQRQQEQQGQQPQQQPAPQKPPPL